MINYKSFYRKKTTKIYFIILSIILVTIMILQSFINYYIRTSDELFSKRSILIVTSKEDYINKLKTYQEIKNIKNYLIFIPNKSYKTIIDPGYQMQDSKGNIVESNLNENEFAVDWGIFNILDFDDNILVTSDKIQEQKLLDNEIAFGVSPFFLKNKDINFNSVINEKIGFFYNNDSTEFKISYFYESNWPEITISNNLYEKLNKTKESFTYAATVASYQNENKIKRELIEYGNKSNTKVVLESSFNGTEGFMISNITDILSIITLINWFIIIIFLIIIFIIIKNIIADSRKTNDLKRKIGYNKNQIVKNMIINLLSLQIIVFIFSLTTSFIFIKIINMVTSFKLLFFNNLTFIILFCIIFLMDIFVCFVKTNKYVKL